MPVGDISQGDDRWMSLRAYEIYGRFESIVASRWADVDSWWASTGENMAREYADSLFLPEVLVPQLLQMVHESYTELGRVRRRQASGELPLEEDLADDDVSPDMEIPLVQEFHLAGVYDLWDSACLPPEPRPLEDTSPRDAEWLCAQWLGWMGGANYRVTQQTRDGGVDVEADGLVAQVKHSLRATPSGPVHQLYGVARHRNVFAAFFSLSGYTDDAVRWSEDVELPLFSYSPAEGSLTAWTERADEMARHGVSAAEGSRWGEWIERRMTGVTTEDYSAWWRPSES